MKNNEIFDFEKKKLHCSNNSSRKKGKKNIKK